MTPEEITNLVYSDILKIIGWTVATVTPVITGLIVALGLLWNRNNKKDEEIKELNVSLVSYQKEYYETLKSLVPFFEKTAEVQARIYDMCELILTAVELPTKDIKIELDRLIKDMSEKKLSDIELKNKLDVLISLWGNNGQPKNN